MQTGSHESPAIEASICRSVQGTRLRSTRVSTRRFRARLRSTCWQGRLRGAENNAAPKPLEPLKRQRVNQQLVNRQLMRRQAVNRQPAQLVNRQLVNRQQMTQSAHSLDLHLISLCSILQHSYGYLKTLNIMQSKSSQW